MPCAVVAQPLRGGVVADVVGQLRRPSPQEGGRPCGAGAVIASVAEEPHEPGA